MLKACAIITTLDNLLLLKEQVPILQADSFINKIIVVSNGSNDGTNEWLINQDIIPVVRENRGAGPGRNAGLDAAEKFDYALMLDGGIRPLVNGTKYMLDYLEGHPDIDVLGVEVPHFETDREKAWRRWPGPITDEQTYRHSHLSLTAYCLTKASAWNNLRFSEEGPFGEPGWGVDDDEMACQWANAGVVSHAITNIHPYRRGSGSFRRLFQETGIWPNQYGSVYEKRLVWMQQNWPQYGRGVQWDEPWLTVIIRVGELRETIEIIRYAHSELRKRTFGKPWNNIPNPYSIIAWNPTREFSEWAEPRRLRQQHGNKIIVGKKIVERTRENNDVWTGDFRIWEGSNYRDAVRPNAHYYIIANNKAELLGALELYNTVYPPREDNVPPPINLTELRLE